MSKRILTPEQEVFVRECYNSRVASANKLAETFGVSKQTIYYAINPVRREKLYKAQRKYRNRKKAKAAKPVSKSEVTDNLRNLTLAEVSQKVQDGTKRIQGEIRNATIEDLATLNDMFNVKFTVYFE